MRVAPVVNGFTTIAASRYADPPENGEPLPRTGGVAFLDIPLGAVNGWPWQTAWQLVGPKGAA